MAGRFRVTGFLLIVSIVLKPSSGYANANCCSGIANRQKFDCHPEAGASRQSCESRGCCWSPVKAANGRLPYLNVPYCFYPRNYPGDKYKTNKTSSESSPFVQHEEPPGCSGIANSQKFDCYPEAGASRQSCESRGCCWVPVQAADGRLPYLNVPYCFYPRNYPGYKYDRIDVTDFGLTATLNLEPWTPSPFPKVVKKLQMNVYFMSESTLRVKIFDPLDARYEVPIPKINFKQEIGRNRTLDLYEFDLITPSGFQIKRKSDKTVLMDTNVGSMIFSDQFLQISTKLPSSNVYGLGEYLGAFRHSFDWKRVVLFASDHAPTVGKSLYGSHPFYLNMEPSGKSHGVLLFNSNALEAIFQPMPALTYRSLGGILDFYIVLGPTPNSVVSQYTDLIGRPMIPPYWSLGFHLCRYNYLSVNRTREIWMRNRKFGIPFDVQWNDIDYMAEKKDFTYDLDKFGTLPQFVDEIHKAGMKYVTIIDPAISSNQPTGTYPPYDDGVTMDIFIKDINGKYLKGKVWPPGPSVFPDFTNEKTSSYWSKQFKLFHDKIHIDGAWIDMNEPSNFVHGSMEGCPANTLENPPYLPPLDYGSLAGKTLCMTARQKASVHYNVHNLYGISEAIATNKALRNLNKRPFIISRSTFVGSGKYGGHWSGDIASTWDQMKMSIASILRSNIFGVPMVGADICGFLGNTTPELCQRWMELGAFYPFSRNHNDDTSIDQDPVAFGPGVAKSSKDALTIRYELLPYFYTLFYESHAFGTPVARPLFFEFPHDRITYGIDTQFLLGPSVMVLPVLEKGATNVMGYFPTGIWYHYDQNSTVNSRGMNKLIETPLDKINIYFRGGSVIPTQVPAVTTEQSRLNDFRIVVAFDKNGTATGSLYLDDGITTDPVESGNYATIEFVALLRGWFYSHPVKKGYVSKQTVGQVTFLGMSEGAPSQISANGQPAKFTFDKERSIMVVNKLNLPLNEKIDIIWKY